jgi:hypothetical protein
MPEWFVNNVGAIIVEAEIADYDHPNGKESSIEM